MASGRGEAHPYVCGPIVGILNVKNRKIERVAEVAPVSRAAWRFI